MRAIISSFLLVAVSEMGDKTQLLALSLAARYRRPRVVLLGVLTATVANHALASLLGSWISEHVPPRAMAGGLAVLFLAFALWTLRPDTLVEQRAPSRLGPYLTTTVLFDREIVRILDKHCVMCHVEKGPAFPLETYEQTWESAVACKAAGAAMSGASAWALAASAAARRRSPWRSASRLCSYNTAPR